MFSVFKVVLTFIKGEGGNANTSAIAPLESSLQIAVKSKRLKGLSINVMTVFILQLVRIEMLDQFSSLLCLGAGRPACLKRTNSRTQI